MKDTTGLLIFVLESYFTYIYSYLCNRDKNSSCLRIHNFSSLPPTPTDYANGAEEDPTKTDGELEKHKYYSQWRRESRTEQVLVNIFYKETGSKYFMFWGSHVDSVTNSLFFVYFKNLKTILSLRATQK